MKKKLLIGAGLTGWLSTISAPVYAHCPLCTAGAGALAGSVALLGVNYGAIGVFLGAFATALGLWMPRLVKKQFVPRQSLIIFWAVYLSTLLPLLPFTKDYSSIFISVYGDYGGHLNRTYLINWFIIGAVLGTLIVWLSPRLSAYITRRREGRIVRFQGLIITLLLLTITGVLMQILR
jgi:hypothetical protein